MPCHTRSGLAKNFLDSAHRGRLKVLHMARLWPEPLRPSPIDRPLTIGVFARRSRLSPKALRLYDRLGLLTPESIDRETGYRRYRESQLAAARLVVMLRRLNMPLAEVAELLAAPASRRAELLASYWESVERRHASQRELAAHLQLRLSGNENTLQAFEIRERDVPAQVVLTEQRHLPIGELSDWIGAAAIRLSVAAEPFGGPAGHPFVVYHGEVNEDSDGPVEFCLPLDPATPLVKVAPMRHEPAHTEAYTTLRKAQVEFPQVLSAYDALHNWAAINDRVQVSSPREVYFNDFRSAAPGDEVCDVSLPIR